MTTIIVGRWTFGIFEDLQTGGQRSLLEGDENDITCFVEECAICQQNKYQALSPSGLLQPLPILHQIWDDISMDFIEGLPKSEGFDAIMLVVNQLSMLIFRHSSIHFLLNPLLPYSLRTLYAFMACLGPLFPIGIRPSLAIFGLSCSGCKELL